MTPEQKNKEFCERHNYFYIQYHDTNASLFLRCAAEHCTGPAKYTIDHIENRFLPLSHCEQCHFEYVIYLRQTHRIIAQYSGQIGPYPATPVIDWRISGE